MQLLKSRTDEIPLHLREVDIPAIQICRMIAFFLQASGNTRQMTHFVRHFHHRHRGEGEIPAQGTHRPSVCTIAVAIAVRELYPLPGCLPQVGHHLQEHAPATLQQYHHHIRTLCLQQRVSCHTPIVIQPLRQLFQLPGIIEVIHHIVTRRTLQRRKETEHRVHRRMVQKLVL